MTGKEFRKWRRNLEITQQEVADYCNINISSISRWEHELININNSIYKLIMEFAESN